MSVPTPADAPKLEDCIFYHVMDLPGVGTVDSYGSWDLRDRFADYTGGVELAGRSFLDVGTASGFLSFEAEKRGASVTSFEAASAASRQLFPAGEAERAKHERYWLGMVNGYRFAHRCLGSRAAAVYGDVHHLAEQVPQHDVVLLGQILVHLRDPLAALRQATLVARETLIIAEGSFEAEAPLAVFLGGGGTDQSWWHLSVPLYRKFLALFGFDLAQAAKQSYRCNDPVLPRDVDVWTFVAHRRAKPA